jgi:hypothetical protein
MFQFSIFKQNTNFGFHLFRYRIAVAAHKFIEN